MADTCPVCKLTYPVVFMHPEHDDSPLANDEDAAQEFLEKHNTAHFYGTAANWTGGTPAMTARDRQIRSCTALEGFLDEAEFWPVGWNQAKVDAWVAAREESGTREYVNNDGKCRSCGASGGVEVAGRDYDPNASVRIVEASLPSQAALDAKDQGKHPFWETQDMRFVCFSNRRA